MEKNIIQNLSFTLKILQLFNIYFLNSFWENNGSVWGDTNLSVWMDIGFSKKELLIDYDKVIKIRIRLSHYNFLKKIETLTLSFCFSFECNSTINQLFLIHTTLLILRMNTKHIKSITTIMTSTKILIGWDIHLNQFSGRWYS